MSRIRAAVMASHKPDELKAAANVLAKAAIAVGFTPGEYMPSEFGLPQRQSAQQGRVFDEDADELAVA